MYYLMLCPCCGTGVALHELDQKSAKSLLIDPRTGLPPNNDPITGELTTPTPEAMNRSRRRPLCKQCLTEYEKTGVFHFSVRLTGENEAIIVADGIPLIDDQNRVMAVQCPDDSCGQVVDVTGGKMEEHYTHGRKCHTSGVPVEIVD